MADLLGALCISNQLPYKWRRLDLDLLLWQRSSNLSDIFFVAILLLLSIEPTTPVPSWVSSQRKEHPSSYNDDHNISEMAGAPAFGRRARTTRKKPSNFVQTTLFFGAYFSSRLLVPPVGRRARTTRTTPSNYVRTTQLFGAHSSSRLLVASVPRQLCRIDHSAAELPKPCASDLFAPRSASMLHCTSPRAASTSPKIAR